MTWYAIEVRAEADRRDAVAAWLVGRTGQAVEERADGTLVSFALDLPDAKAMEIALAAGPGHGAATVIREFPEHDWTSAWKEGLDVRHIGRFAIVPTWIEYSPKPDDIVIRLDPESAFGSGEHGSTRAALALLGRYAHPGDTVLDLGSGSGILTIAAAKLDAGCAVGVDVDSESLTIAEANAERNGVGSDATFLGGDAAQLAPLLAPADVIVSNILRVVNMALLPEIRAALRRSGIAIFSGMETAEAPDFRSALGAGAFVIRDELVDEGWWAVAATPA